MRFLARLEVRGEFRLRCKQQCNDHRGEPVSLLSYPLRSRCVVERTIPEPTFRHASTLRNLTWRTSPRGMYRLDRIPLDFLYREIECSAPILSRNWLSINPTRATLRLKCRGTVEPLTLEIRSLFKRDLFSYCFFRFHVCSGGEVRSQILSEGNRI